MPRLLVVALSVPTVVLAVVTLVGAFRDPSGLPEENVSVAIQASIGITFLAVGLLIVARMPRHAIGWILVALALDTSLLMFTDRLRASDPSAAELLQIITGVSWVLAVALLVIFMLVFPTGRPISPRWRWAVWSAAIWPVLVIALAAASPETVQDARPQPDQEGAIGPLEQVVVLLLYVLIWAIVPLLFVGGAALVARFARARGDERQQLKWVAFAGACIASVALLTFTPVWGGWLALLDDLSLVVLPIAIAIAILRHRLYDIDVIIRRTLVYGSLTVLLGAAYVASVVTLTQFLGAFARDNQLAVAASTVGVAILFQPLRRRVQDSVDRRFYRSRVHAGRVVEALGAQLRNEVDFVSLTADLCGAVTETLQPTSTSVWLRWRPESAR